MKNLIIIIALIFISQSCATKSRSNMNPQLNVDNVIEKLKLTKPNYEKRTLSVEGTEFAVVDRVGKGFDPKMIENSIRKAWPVFIEIFGNRIKNAIVADFEAPVGGGPISLDDPFVVGIYGMDSIIPQFQDYINRVTGWKNQNSTSDYIKENYSHFSDPMQAYVDDMVIHELGHFFFGFGVTKTNFTDLTLSWVPLGLGIVYDRIVWDRFYDKPSPMFHNVELIWKDKFSKMKEVDQRLQSPDTTLDGKYGLERLQIYNHGKAYAYLKELRESVGKEYFDEKILKIFDDVGNSEYFTYELLIKYLTEDESKKPIIKKLESDFVI